MLPAVFSHPHASRGFLPSKLCCFFTFPSVKNASAGSMGSAWDYWKKMCPRNTPAMSAKTLQVEISGAGVPAVCM